MTQPMYEIRVAGVVPEEDLHDMGAVTAAPCQVSTILYGVPDQAALYCLLARLRALGVEAIGLRRGSAALTEPGAEADEVPLRTCYEVALTGGLVDLGRRLRSTRGEAHRHDQHLPAACLPAHRHPEHRGDARGARTDDPEHRWPPREKRDRHESRFTRSG